MCQDVSHKGNLCGGGEETMKHVIIGAGAAGITAAKTIRELHPSDEIVIISEDEQVISRVMLYKYISGDRDADSLSFVPKDFFDQENITWLSGCRVMGIDTEAKKISCRQRAEIAREIFYNWETISYDKLLIATGMLSTVPPVGRLRIANNAFGLRDMADAKAIKEAAESAKEVVVIGGGLVGLSVAYALLQLGKKVHVVEMADHILPLNLDAGAAETYQSKFEEAGAIFHLGCKVADTKEDTFGNITHLKLEGDVELPCDFVVMATGAVPKIDFLENSNIPCDKAVIVDNHMATRVADIYAAGDVTGLSGIWPNAKHQGEIAAKNMCGEVTLYEDSFAIKNTINKFGIATLTIGEREPQEGDRVEVRADRKGYKKLIIRDNQIVGVILQGDISNSGFWQYMVKNDIKIDGINKPIWKISFADFFDISEEGEYNWLISA